MSYRQHPVAALFPPRLLSVAEAKELRGWEEGEVVARGDEILVGYDIYNILSDSGYFFVREYVGDDPVGFIVQRHLEQGEYSPAQRALIAAAMVNDTRNVPSSDPDVIKLDRACQLMSVSPAQLGRARAVVNGARPALYKLAWFGNIPLVHAAKASSLTPSEQDAFLDRVIAGVEPRKAFSPPMDPKKRPSPRAGRPSHKEQLERLDNMLEVALIPFSAMHSANNIDTTVTKEDASSVAEGLGQKIRALTKLHRLVKEIANV